MLSLFRRQFSEFRPVSRSRGHQGWGRQWPLAARTTGDKLVMNVPRIFFNRNQILSLVRILQGCYETAGHHVDLTPTYPSTISLYSPQVPQFLKHSTFSAPGLPTMLVVLYEYSLTFLSQWVAGLGFLHHRSVVLSHGFTSESPRRILENADTYSICQDSSVPISGIGPRRYSFFF